MKSDIWALGCVLYELISGCKAFSDDFRVFEYVFRKEKPNIPAFVDPMDERPNLYVSQFLHSMLEID
jgi:serine/threonine protein kinase